MKSEYIPPQLNARAFNCPKCQVYAKQEWFYLNAAERPDGCGSNRYDDRFRVSYCGNCCFPTIWHGEQIVYPTHLTAQPPNPDLPDEIKADYDEARAIVNQSPRGAAALLRLSIQKLCKHLGQSGDNINSDIKALVFNGLPRTVQQALDAVRVIGNNAVHPGSIDLRDDRETATALFKLVNLITEKMITEPRQINEIYNSLPQSARDAIDKRDK